MVAHTIIIVCGSHIAAWELSLSFILLSTVLRPRILSLVVVQDKTIVIVYMLVIFFKEFYLKKYIK